MWLLYNLRQLFPRPVVRFALHLHASTRPAARKRLVRHRAASVPGGGAFWHRHWVRGVLCGASLSGYHRCDTVEPDQGDADGTARTGRGRATDCGKKGGRRLILPPLASF